MISAGVVAFYGLAAVVVAAAIVVVSARSIFRAALALAAALAGVGGLFLLLQAEFLAVAQVLIYVGAVVVLVLFAVMLTSHAEELKARQTNEQAGLGFMAAALLLGFIWLAVRDTSGLRLPVAVEHVPIPGGNSVEIGRAFLTTWILPFEVVSVFLLAALIGAILIARPGATEKKP